MLFQLDLLMQQKLGFPCLKVMSRLHSYLDPPTVCSFDCEFKGMKFTGCNGVPDVGPYDLVEYGYARHHISNKKCRFHFSCWGRLVELQPGFALRRHSLFCVCEDVAVAFTTAPPGSSINDVEWYNPVFHPPFAIHYCRRRCNWKMKCDKQHSRKDPTIICEVRCPHCEKVDGRVDYDDDGNSVYEYDEEEDDEYEYHPQVQYRDRR